MRFGPSADAALEAMVLAWIGGGWSAAISLETNANPAATTTRGIRVAVVIRVLVTGK